jgi:hypothetical protein
MGACRDCKNCTNSTVVHAARLTMRGALAVGTYGMTEAALAMRKKCRQCGHQMSLHGFDQVSGLPQPLVETQSDSGFKKRGFFSKPGAQPIPPAAPAAPSTAEATSPASVADELMKLAQLRDAGVLTSEEFEAQKAKLLGG